MNKTGIGTASKASKAQYILTERTLVTCPLLTLLDLRGRSIASLLILSETSATTQFKAYELDTGEIVTDLKKFLLSIPCEYNFNVEEGLEWEASDMELGACVRRELVGVRTE